MLERRTPSGVNRSYDSGGAGDGVLVWRVTTGAAIPVTHLGAPGGVVGGNSVWKDGQSFAPSWSDGTSSRTTLTFRAAAPDYRVELSRS